MDNLILTFMKWFKQGVLIGFSMLIITGACTSRVVDWKNKHKADLIHAVTDLSHEFTFYADNRFHQQYLPTHKGVMNWCNLHNFDLSNTNLLLLLACDNRINYCEKDKAVIKQFLKDGGGVVICGSHSAKSQNELLANYGVKFTKPAGYPLKANGDYSQKAIEGKGNSIASLKEHAKWDVIVEDAYQAPVMARRKIGKGTLLVASRNLAGNHPSASDSINRHLWKPILEEVASGKTIDPTQAHHSRGIDQLEYNDDHGTFKLSYNDNLRPYADKMVDLYKRSLPYIEKRMGVSLSPGMASQITLLATGGGGFSSGHTVALAVWWGGFPDKEDSMIEFMTHEAVHSWVLPFPEVWNEPIATYVGNLVMMDMGHEEEAIKRIQNTINRAYRHDPSMKQYDINGHLTGNGKELDKSAKNDMHWGKTYWLFEELRKKNPDFLADYFRLKRQLATPAKISQYDMNNTVAVLSMAMRHDLFELFTANGMPVDESKAEIKMELMEILNK